MRRLLSGLTGLLAVLLLPVALVGLWANQTLTRTDAFVEALAPVVRQPAVQQALVDEAARAVFDATGLPPAAQRLTEPTLRAETARLVASPAVVTVWSSAVRVAHTEVIAILKGEADTGVNARGQVVLNLRIPVPPLTAVLEQAGVPDAGRLAPTVAIPLVSVEQLDRTQLAYRWLTMAWPWLFVGVVVLALLAVALARRRRAATGALAIGWIVVSAALALVVAAAREPLVNDVAHPVARAVVDAAYGVAAAGITAEVWVAVGVSVALLVVVVVGRLVAGPAGSSRPAHG